MNFIRLYGFVFGIGALTAVASAQYDPYFHWLGDLPGGINYSDVWGSSSNGVYASGTSSGLTGYTAYRWSAGTGMQDFGEPFGGSIGGSGRDVSNTGVVVGGGFGSSGHVAFRSVNAVVTSLGDFAGGDFSSDAWGVSDDGSVVVGFGTTASSREPFRWTEATGMVSLGSLPGGTNYGEAFAVSGDGSTIVGKSSGTDGTGAFRWTEGGGMVSLGTLPGAPLGGEAFDVNGDGTVIVGQAWTTNGSAEAFRWTQATGMVGLGDFEFGGFSSFALGTSTDGNVVVGFGSGENGTEAFYWDTVNGMSNLGQLLTAKGLGPQFAGYTLTAAKEVYLTEFGVPVIYGYATSGSTTRAFVAAVPEPTSMVALTMAAAMLLRRRRKI